MSVFNFDAESNIINNKTPCIKAINKLFCGQRSAAGLWASDESMEACCWKKENDNYVNTKTHIVQGQIEEISGRGIINPRMCIIRRTKLLKVISETGSFSGLWVKGDGEFKNEQGNKKYACVRKYLIMFLDENNYPLHKIPLQFTAKGTFQISFDQALQSFRNDIKTCYSRSMKRQIGQMNDLWYAMCVFVPTFESKTVGKTQLISQACAVKSYLVPSESDWITLCVGRNLEVNEIIYLVFNESEEWMKRFDKPFSQLSIDNDVFDSRSSISDDSI